MKALSTTIKRQMTCSLLAIFPIALLGSVYAEWTTGIVGGALKFDGSTDYISVPDDASLDWGLADSFTIELWANFTNVSNQNKVMIGRDQGGGYPHWWLGCEQNSGIAVFNLLDTTNNGVELNSTTVINDGKWHHIVQGNRI